MLFPLLFPVPDELLLVCLAFTVTVIVWLILFPWYDSLSLSSDTVPDKLILYVPSFSALYEILFENVAFLASSVADAYAVVLLVESELLTCRSQAAAV